VKPLLDLLGAPGGEQPAGDRVGDRLLGRRSVELAPFEPVEQATEVKSPMKRCSPTTFPSSSSFFTPM
jgi:hypothetical protein